MTAYKTINGTYPSKTICELLGLEFETIKSHDLTDLSEWVDLGSVNFLWYDGDEEKVLSFEIEYEKDYRIEYGNGQDPDNDDRNIEWFWETCTIGNKTFTDTKQLIKLFGNELSSHIVDYLESDIQN